MDEIRLIWGNNLREARKAADLTQAELAELLGTTQQAIAKWETGKSVPRDETRWRLASELGVPAHELFPAPEAA